MSQLKVKIGGDASQFRREMNSVRKSAAGIGSTLKSSLGGLGGALGLSLGVSGIVAIGKASIDAADAIGKGAARTSMGVAEYQKLSLMAEQAGASITSVESSVKRMTRVIRDAGQGLTTGTRVMEAFGFAAADFEGLSTHQAFEKIVTAIRGVEDPIQRLALAQEAFGRGAAQLMPMILDYDTLRESIANVTLMTEKNVKAAEAFNDSMGRVKTSIQSGLVNSGAIGYLADLADAFDVVVSSADGWAIFGKELLKSPLGSIASHGVDSLSNSSSVMAGAATPQEMDEARKGRRDAKAERASEEVRKKQAEGAEEARKKAAFEADIDKQIEEELALRAKAAKKLSDELGAMDHAIKLQELKNEGLEREAAIMDALYNAQKRLGELSDADRKKIEEQAGRLFDLRKTVDTPAESEAPEFARERMAGPTSLERIGAILGGGITSDPAVVIQKALKALAEKQLKVQEKILDKTGSGLTLTE